LSYQFPYEYIMSTLTNSVMLIGHLGDAPKVIQFESGRKIANFSLATSEIQIDRDGNRISETTWHRMVAIGKMANMAQKYLQKGTEIAVEGKIANRTWGDREGNRHFVTEVIVNSLILLSKKSILEN
jgi:single-strand DNA-binding protein